MAKIAKIRRTHNATMSQLLSWLIFKISRQRRTQEKRVLLYLTEKAANSRQLSTDLKIDRTSMTRTLRDLQDYGLVRIETIAKCPFTNRLTQFYTTVRVDSDTAKVDPLRGTQGELFNDSKTDAK